MNKVTPPANPDEMGSIPDKIYMYQVAQMIFEGMQTGHLKRQDLVEKAVLKVKYQRIGKAYG